MGMDARSSEEADWATGHLEAMHRNYAEWIEPAESSRQSVDDGVALLAQELGNVVHRQARLAGRAGALPAAERLDARPRTGRRAGSAVDVQDPCLRLVEEALDLALVLADEANLKIGARAGLPRRSTVAAVWAKYFPGVDLPAWVPRD